MDEKVSLKEKAYDIIMQINVFQQNIQILSNQLNQINQQIQNEKKSNNSADQQSGNITN